MVLEFEIEQTSELGRKLQVTIPESEVEAEIQSRIDRLAKEVRLKGFRPGKVPKNVIETRYGEQVRGEVFEELMRRAIGEALEDEDVRIAAPPSVSQPSYVSGKPLEFTASFEVFPEIGDLRLEDLKLERPVAEVSDEDVEAMIDNLRQQRAQWVDVQRAAEEGDLVFFAFHAKTADGRFPDEDVERAGAILGRGMFGSQFESELGGAKPGDTKNFEATLPEDFREKKLAGKPASYAVEIIKVQEQQLPEIDDDFFASFGVDDGGEEAFRRDVRANMERELRQAVGNRLREQVIARLLDLHDNLKVPESLVEQEKQGMIQNLQERAKQSGATLPDGAVDGLGDEARKRVQSGLLIGEIVRRAELEVDRERLRAYLLELAATYEDPDGMLQLYQQNPQLMASVENLVLEQQAVEHAVEQASVEEKPASFADLLGHT